MPHLLKIGLKLWICGNSLILAQRETGQMARLILYCI